MLLRDYGDIQVTHFTVIQLYRIIKYLLLNRTQLFLSEWHIVSLHSITSMLTPFLTPPAPPSYFGLMTYIVFAIPTNVVVLHPQQHPLRP